MRRRHPSVFLLSPEGKEAAQLCKLKTESNQNARSTTSRTQHAEETHNFCRVLVRDLCVCVRYVCMCVWACVCVCVERESEGVPGSDWWSVLQRDDVTRRHRSHRQSPKHLDQASSFQNAESTFCSPHWLLPLSPSEAVVCERQSHTHTHNGPHAMPRLFQTHTHFPRFVVSQWTLSVSCQRGVAVGAKLKSVARIVKCEECVCVCVCVCVCGLERKCGCGEVTMPVLSCVAHPRFFLRLFSDEPLALQKHYFSN